MDNSPFRRLSPEIRNMIYEEIFTSSEVFLDNFQHGAGAVLQVCHDIRQEACLLLFSKVEIKIKYKGYSSSSQQHVAQSGLGVAFSKALGYAKHFVAALHDTFGKPVVDAIGCRPIPVVLWSNRYFRLDCPKCNPSGIGNSGSAGTAEQVNTTEENDGNEDEETKVLAPEGSKLKAKRPYMHLEVFCESVAAFLEKYKDIEDQSILEFSVGCGTS